jgi:OmpA-OmpF porin, OOP family
MFANSKLTQEEVRMRITLIAVSMIAALSLTAISALGGDDSEVKGMIISRTGDTVIVSSSGEKTTVLLTDDTSTRDNKGLFGLEKHELGNTVLIPGLKVKVKGEADDQGRIVAKTITVDGDDLEIAEMIQAGLHPTAEQVETNVQAIERNNQSITSHGTQLAAQREDIAANKQQIDQNIKDIDEHTERFESLADYDVKDQAVLNFAVGSAKLSDEDKQELNKVAGTAKGISGYIIEVAGFADSTGGAAMNTKLSEERAKAVVTYLHQQGGVPVRHIVAPGAMGEYQPVASNESKTGRAENRRVEVKILVNKGIAGS